MENNLFEHYFGLENKVKQLLEETSIDTYKGIYNNLPSNEKAYLKETPATLNWILNINTVNKNRGEISTSSLQKVK
jgi:hypothetical protein